MNTLDTVGRMRGIIAGIVLLCLSWSAFLIGGLNA